MQARYRVTDASGEEGSRGSLEAAGQVDGNAANDGESERVGQGDRLEEREALNRAGADAAGGTDTAFLGGRTVRWFGGVSRGLGHRVVVTDILGVMLVP